MTSFTENPESADRTSKPLALQGRAQVGDIWAAGCQPTGIRAVERFQAVRAADAEAMWTDGANCLGTSSGVAIVQQALQGRRAS